MNTLDKIQFLNEMYEEIDKNSGESYIMIDKHQICTDVGYSLMTITFYKNILIERLNNSLNN